MTQLTSVGAMFSFRRQISTGHRMLYSGHPKQTAVVVFPILTANDGSAGSFYVSAEVCFQILHVISHDMALSFSYAPRRWEAWILTM